MGVTRLAMASAPLSTPCSRRRSRRATRTHWTSAYVVTLATLLVTVGLAFHVPKGFFPVEDTGMIVGVTEAAPDVSFAKMMELQERAANAVLTDPDVATVSSFIGADGTNPTQNSGRLSIALVPREHRLVGSARLVPAALLLLGPGLGF